MLCPKEWIQKALKRKLPQCSMSILLLEKIVFGVVLSLASMQTAHQAGFPILHFQVNLEPVTFMKILQKSHLLAFGSAEGPYPRWPIMRYNKSARLVL